MWNSLKTMWIVFLHMFRRRVTIQYPDEKPNIPPRWRGRIILSRDPDGEERCVACYLCAAACPVDCIALQATEDEHGRRYPEFFRINFSRCIFCGYCEVACPFDAITMGHDYELSDYNRSDLIFTKEMLLAEPLDLLANSAGRRRRLAQPEPPPRRTLKGPLDYITDEYNALLRAFGEDPADPEDER